MAGACRSGFHRFAESLAIDKTICFSHSIPYGEAYRFAYANGKTVVNTFGLSIPRRLAQRFPCGGALRDGDALPRADDARSGRRSQSRG